MPMRYATEADVLAQLRLTDESAEYERLVRLENGLCDVFDHKTGTSFGTAPVAEMREINIGEHGAFDYFAADYFAYIHGPSWNPNRLLFNVPLRSITSIEIDGDWNGTAWVDGTLLTADEYRLTSQTEQGFYAIDLVSGTWSGVVRITGVWGDQVTQTVPNDVREALTFLTVNEWHTRNASPAGQIGPDGLMMTPRNPWAFEVVKAALDRHTVVRVLV